MLYNRCKDIHKFGNKYLPSAYKTQVEFRSHFSGKKVRLTVREIRYISFCHQLTDPVSISVLEKSKMMDNGYKNNQVYCITPSSESFALSTSNYSKEQLHLKFHFIKQSFL